MIAIDRTQEKALSELANEYELKLIVLFGSQVSGRTHQESDYDIAFLSDRELSLSEQSGLGGGLMPILRIKDERLVNMVDIKTAGPLMLYSITGKGQVLFERKPSFFLSLKLYAWKVFADTQFFRDNYFRIVKERVYKM